MRRPAGFGRRTCVRPDGGLPLRLREAPQVFLKSITLHGFKSFAGRTTLELPKGIAAVVGPNGSGKSNIADAIRWVLGEQSVRLLRGTRLERRDLRRERAKEVPGDGGGLPHLRQHRRADPPGILRGDRHPPGLPVRRERVLHQPHALPPRGYPGAVSRYGARARVALPSSARARWTPS